MFGFFFQAEISDITFLSPTTCAVASVSIWFICIIIEMDLSSLLEIWDLAFDEILVIHLTVRLLLHSVPGDLLLIAGDASMATLIASTSDASSRSEFIIHTLRLS